MAQSNSTVNISQFNVSKWMNNTINTVKNTFSTTNSTSSRFNNIAIPSLTSSFHTNTDGWLSIVGRVGAYLFSIVFVILAISFFITPIIKLRPGDPGLFYIPLRDDGVLFWPKGKDNEIDNKLLPISETSYNYSLMMDVLIQDPNAFSRNIRLIFARAPTYQSPAPSSSTIPKELLSNYNLMVGLMPDTNDMIVSVLNKDNNSENAIIQNIPIQEVFRLGVVVMENTLEVYINGHLVKTRSYVSTPKAVTGPISGGIGKDVTVAKLRNLKIWNRILRTAEIRESPPRLSTYEEMSGTPAPNTAGSCSS